MISKSIAKDQTDWDIILEIITFNYNCNIHSATKYSPHSLVYGCLPRLPLDNLIDPENNLRIDDVKNIRTKQNILLKQNDTSDEYNKYRLEKNIKIGSIVMLIRHVYTPRLSKKLQDLYIGPFKITKQIDSLHYKVKDLTGKRRKKFEIVHVNRIKLVHKDIVESPDSMELGNTKVKALPTTPPLTGLSTSSPTTSDTLSKDSKSIKFQTRSGRITTKPVSYRDNRVKTT